MCAGTTLELHPLNGKTQLKDFSKKDESINFLGIKFFKDSRVLPENAEDKFIKMFHFIFSSPNIRRFKKRQLLNAFHLYACGWERYYMRFCKSDYLERIKPILISEIRQASAIKIRGGNKNSRNNKKIKRSYLEANLENLCAWNCKKNK